MYNYAAMDMHIMRNTMFESSNDVDREAVYILDPPITIPASLTMTTFAALHTKNINIPKRNCVEGAPVFVVIALLFPAKEAFISRRSIRTYYKKGSKIPYIQKMMLFQLCAM
ncbi:hypothetical protein CEXT_458951 [Caerostris extrusa]|uniref:Uncharacterized protein n=1 Tax=Caerostris extrusa TaxID=172846 RepID=A0AAV4MGI1_CAEEX|nr:hypothetical protein CEXT_458951 [Caerostris extrusa]